MNLSQQQIDHMIATMTKGERQAWIQNEGYRAWLAANCRGTEECATGVGKTRIGIRAAAEELERNPNALIYIVVPTITLKDVDWPNEMKEMSLEGLEKKVKMLCWASLGRQKPARDVDLIVLDEVHHITATSYAFFKREEYKVFKILGLTATLPGHKWENDIEKNKMIRNLCPSCFQVSLEEAIELKIIIEFQLYVLSFDLDDKINYVDGGTMKKPYKTTEFKHYKMLTKQLQRATFTKGAEGLKQAMMQKRTQFLSKLISKKQLCKDVIEATITKNERTLIFFGSIEQSKEICGVNVYNSKSTDEKLTAFCNEEINYLGVVDALNEGKNIPNVDQSIIVQGNSKELTLFQRIGRNVRWRENHVAKIILLVARKTADEKWMISATANINPKRIKHHYVLPKSTV